MNKICTFLLLVWMPLVTVCAQIHRPCLVNRNNAVQLQVNDRPYLILGGELGNSSASSVADIQRIFPKLHRMGLNTVLVPAYWDLIEPVEGQFDFSLTDAVLQEARKNDLKVIFLWFGVWKNSMSCYAPAWFKKDYKKYPRAHTKDGKPLEIASAFSSNVFDADSKAFGQWLKHLAAMDNEQGTVLMIQIENEIGMLESARDHSKEAEALYRKSVPAKLINYLKDHTSELHPIFRARWEGHGASLKGTWAEVFGADEYGDEVFMAYYYADYVERMAQLARSVFNVPLYVNAAMNSRGRKPGEYPSAGPLAHLKDIWHCAAPSIDMLAPDLYDKGFTDWVAQYKLPDNPLFIPEIRLDDNDGVRAFYVFGEHDALGFSPFSIEDGSDAPTSSLAMAYAKLRELMPLILKYQGTGAMNGFWFDQNHKEQILLRDGYRITGRHFFTLPWDPRATDGSVWPEGGGLLIRLDKDEYLMAGNGMVLTFENEKENIVTKLRLGEDGFVEKGGGSELQSQWSGNNRVGILSVDQIEIQADGSFKRIRRLNGDQDHQGRHARISVGDFEILHVKLYEYN